jgi:hypothetical protein
VSNCRSIIEFQKYGGANGAIVSNNKMETNLENLAKLALVGIAVFVVPHFLKSHFETWQIAVAVAAITGLGLYALQQFFTS